MLRPTDVPDEVRMEESRWQYPVCCKGECQMKHRSTCQKTHLCQLLFTDKVESMSD